MSVLKPLYALAIGLLVVAFVGFGISAFYDEPKYPMSYPEGAETTPPDERTPEQKRELEEYREKEKAYQEEYSRYNLVVATVSIGFAVLLLVGSLIWISGLPVIGEGATLGAVFTLFYGLVRAFMTNDEQVRFAAVAIGLVILLFLVYWKFSRSPTPRSTG
jgi:Ca2+/Na+ antiporter